MALPSEVGRHLIRLRNEAGVTQKEVAEKASIYPGVLSRIETGERSVTDDEMQRIIAALDTQNARSFSEALTRAWNYLQRPPIGHPDDGLLWESELCLTRISDLRRELGLGNNGADPFHVRLRLAEEQIKRSAALVRNLEHTIAFVGDIGVGKTTALCALLGLRVSRTPGGRVVEVLEVGTGRTTVCEVQLVQGPAYGLVVECLTDEEVEREVFEFSDFLKRATENVEHEGRDDGEASGEPTFFGTTKEIARCIRNMSRTTEGKARVDPAMELAQTAQDANALAGEIVSRMNLQGRRRREIWYSSESGRDPLVWLEDIFRQVNNGRHPEFSIPRVIEVMLPENILSVETLKLRLVDTKGIDATVERADLERHLIDPGAVVVLCTGFNEAPAVTVQALLERAKAAGIGGLDVKTAVLVLAQAGQALGVKYDDGTEVDTVEEGYSLKADQVWMQLGVRDVECAAVEFFNCREEPAQHVKEALLKLVWGVREQHLLELNAVIRDASAMVDNYQEEQVVADQEEAARLLRVWLDSNRQLPEFVLGLQGGLVSAIQRSHPSSLRASVRREGLWDNLHYGYQMGSGVRSVVDAVVSKRIDGFKEVAQNVVDGLSNAEDLVNQAVRIMENGRTDLRAASNDFGRTIHAYDMRNDKRLWASSEAEWGRGPGYRDRVLAHHRTWFDGKVPGDEGLKSRVQEFVQGEWEALLDQVGSILG